MKITKKILIWLILVLTLTVSGCAKETTLDESILDLGGNLNIDKVTAELKADFLESVNKDLLYKIEDFEPTDEVGVILTLSDTSLLDSYLETRYTTISKYADSKVGKEQIQNIKTRQDKVIQELKNLHLIDSVKYRYNTILDGIYVKTTYDKISKIMEVNGVERVIISNTYARPDAVTNDVKVYSTGIFDSSDVSYTGKGTAVAILDTGCDYTHTAFTTHETVNPLLSRENISDMLGDTVAAKHYFQLHEETLEARDVYYSSKIPYGYDYADKDPDIIPYDSKHGTHVAGIIGGYDDTITGVAIDTQLVIMKVFSDYQEGAEDGDILAALEDSVLLGVDAINMSLGTSCGFTREVDEEYKNSIYDSIEEAGISLIAAASNDYSSAYGSEKGNTNKASNPDSGTVGAPSTYHAALSVASINGNMDKYMFANGTQTVFFNESFNSSAKEYNFYEMLGITSNKAITYEYVTVPGYGMAANYMGIDVKGKIALVKRGDISFEEKVKYAAEAGAIACIVYNNVFGDIIMTVGNDVAIPVVSISKDDGVQMAAKNSGTIEFNMQNLAGPFMSDFSSWGPTPNLELKPEITAHGGNILSAVPGGGYDKLSGTSMASPNMCGITILIRQYVKEKFPNLSTTEIRDMVNQLSTSTATIILDRNGNPYSPRKQGAGLASLFNSVTTGAYVTVDGKNTAKLELGDDPMRNGIFEFSFNIKNISNHDLAYDLSSVIMTESLSTSDEEYVSEMAYILNANTTFEVENGTFNGKNCVVSANSECRVKGTITLSAMDKKYLNRYFENGMFVEGFIQLNSTSDDVDLSIPFLAFYGDWGYAPILDMDYYEEQTEAYNNAIDEEDKKKADYYATTPFGKYYYDYIIPLGSYIYEMDESKYNPIPATKDKAAVSYYIDCISGIYSVFTGLLRGAKELNIEIRNTLTGEVVWQKTEYNCYKAHFSGAPRPYVTDIDLDAGDFGWDNNSQFEVVMTAKLDWDTETQNKNSTYEFSFYVDYETPSVTNAYYYKEYDKAEKEYHYYVDLTVQDNHYAQSVRPVALYTNPETGKLTYSSLVDNPIPVYQKNKGEETVVTIEITDYMDLITESKQQEGLAFYIDDYAMNAGFYYVSLPELDSKNLSFTQSTMELNIGDMVNLNEYIKVVGQETTNTDYFKNLKWTSTNEAVVRVGSGQIEALSNGVATIQCESTVTGKTISMVVTVSGGSEYENNASLEELVFTSYETKFAFTSDNDYSEIGSTGSINFFDGAPRISCYPSESIQLHYRLRPWNLDPSRYELTYSSSNERVVKVDQNGVVTAVDEGEARIYLKIKIDGKQSTMIARCNVTVKSPFIVENRILTEYKGNGGEVIIPDDLGIMYIGAFAFSHYTIDNEIEIEDTNDFDKKKIPFGNNTITSVVIPEGVEEIQKYAFYNCSALTKVVLPSSCKKIFEYAFFDNRVLEEINLDNVVVIGANAFYNCLYLTDINTASVNTIGDSAFENCKQIKSADLRELKRSGEKAFANCVRLTTVIFGEWTKLSENMFLNTRISEATIYSTHIPNEVFKNCTRLTKVVFENDLVYLGHGAFSGCSSLTSIEFKGAVEFIGSAVVDGCNRLTSLTLPSSDVELSDYAFQNCGLTKLIFGESTRLIHTGGAVFKSCSELATIEASNSKYYTVKNQLLYTKDLKTLVLVPIKSNITTYQVPDSLEYIDANAFSGNPNLTKVVFSNNSSIKEIGANAFAECEYLTTVELPNKDVRIGDFAFYHCRSLATISLENVKYIGQYAFSYTPVANIEIASDAVVCEGAFYDTPKLSVVTLGKNAKLEFGAFHSSGVIHVVMPTEGGVEIGDYAFYACKTLATIDLTKVVGKIGDWAFYNCPKLTKVELENVTEIGIRAFSDCVNIKTVVLGNHLEKIGESAFASYSAGTNACLQITNIVIPETLRYIGTEAFYDCHMLQSIDLKNVTKICPQAFAFCSALTNVTLGENLKTLEESVFYGCTNLTTINLEKVEEIHDYTFYGTKLTSIHLDNVKEVGEGAFNNCENLEEVYAPKLEKIGVGAFHTTALHKLEFPSLKEVETQAFLDATATEFLITENLEAVHYAAFVGLDSLTTFYALENGEKVYDATFEHVIISDGVLYTILPTGYYQLVHYPTAKEDTEYTVLENTSRIEYFAAAYNSYLEKVTLPSSLKNIGNFAFYGCENLKEVTFLSYYAPVLEGTMTIEVTVTKDEFSKFDELYRYDFYYFETGQILFPFYYQTFIDTIGSKNTEGLTYIYPENSNGYDHLLYRVYFEDKLDNDGNRIDSGFVMDRYAIDFIEAMAKIGDTVSFANKEKIQMAVTYYNALLAHPEQLQFVDEALIDIILEKEKILNAMIVSDLIQKLYEVDRSKYSYDKVRTAALAFNKLTEEEKTLVNTQNVTKLQQKQVELSQAMGQNLDWTKEFIEYEFVDPIIPPKEEDPKNPTLGIVLGITIGVILVVGGVVTVILIQRKRGKEHE